MNERIKDLTGMTLVAESGKKYMLTKLAGRGAQGVVYEESGNNYMVKLYYPSGSVSVDADVLDRIRYIKNLDMPQNFVSVVDLITHPYVGYVMDKVDGHKPLNSYLIPNRDMSFSEWYNQGLGLYERIFVGYIIAKAFGELEKSNLSYCDISGNNILVRVAKGTSASVKMIDVDNIYTAGRGKAAIIGTPRYIAPEVISRQRTPDVLSDNYSLAVILFELLRAGHPYIGDDVLDGTPEDEENALAGNAEYVTDENSSNMLPEDVVFTDKLKKLFRRCFVDGKHNRLSRPSATEFEYALLEASNKLIKCPSCGAWHYPRKEGKSYLGCPWCDSPSKPTAMLNFNDILFDGPDYRSDEASGTEKERKLVNSYFLKAGSKNRIKGLYALRFDGVGNEKMSTENYATIAYAQDGCHVYNEFCKDGIVVKPYGTNEYIKIENNGERLLRSGDEIYFETDDGKGIAIECGGEKYSFIRMARFSEEKS